MLYLQPLLDRWDKKRRFCYADDFSMLEVGKSAADTSTALSADLDGRLAMGKGQRGDVCPWQVRGICNEDY